MATITTTIIMVMVVTPFVAGADMRIIWWGGRVSRVRCRRWVWRHRWRFITDPQKSIQSTWIFVIINWIINCGTFVRLRTDYWLFDKQMSWIWGWVSRALSIGQRCVRKRLVPQSKATYATTTIGLQIRFFNSRLVVATNMIASCCCFLFFDHYTFAFRMDIKPYLMAYKDVSVGENDKGHYKDAHRVPCYI